jgi:putative ATPase
MVYFQDVLLPFVEQGLLQVGTSFFVLDKMIIDIGVQLIGATTENPSFRIIGALLSRCRYCPSLAVLQGRLGLII